MADETPPGPPESRHGWYVVFGMVAGSAVAGLLCLGVSLLARSHEDWQSNLVFPSLLLLPMLSGLTAAFFWRKVQPTAGETALLCFLLTIFDLAGAGLVLHEGIICLTMASPLLYGFVLTGGMIGRILFSGNWSNLNVSVLPLLALVALAEPSTRSDQTGVVTDSILVHAPPAKVWPQITAFPAIPAPPRFWLFKLGLPYPVATTTAGNFVGADRCCIFSGNAVFKETVSGLVPERELTFDILEVPRDPELIGHLTPHRGQFLLHDNGDSTTTLTGSTWYTLHVRPLWYFDWWTRYVFQAVHLRVMEDVKRRAEA